MTNMRFFALVSILSLGLFPFLALAKDGPHGDEGLLSAKEMRAVANAGGKIMSQSNVLSGGMQVRFGQNGAEPNMDPIRAATYRPVPGGVGMGDFTGTVDQALRNIGSYNLAGGTQIFSAQMINNVVRFSGVNQLQQNTAVMANAVSFPGQAYQNYAYGGQNPTFTNAVNAILGLRADPSGVGSHARMFADYAAKNPESKVLITNDVLRNAGYQVTAVIPSVPSVTQPAGLTQEVWSKKVANNPALLEYEREVLPGNFPQGAPVGQQIKPAGSKQATTSSASGTRVFPNQTTIQKWQWNH